MFALYEPLSGFVPGGGDPRQQGVVETGLE